MQIQINTDHNIEGHEAMAAHVSGIIESALSQVSNHITRVEVHLSDENSDKKRGNDDMLCMMEARIEGHQPVADKKEDETVVSLANRGLPLINLLTAATQADSNVMRK
ncbi:DUF1840 domain-containing protein [Methylicorpusculum oleiharenae]|uniref:DUF1840 family protein n=1 Tax=Methylicorpusculum oleiharenae TaxID=1338687 RepID=UPI001356C081|nr:DUF1840 family protein [Methylicorpusculum oleiharenae]MCD2450583.1 DUF1840 domain-containing protein [Methylicorpusculum oleiharenae]